MQGRRSGGRILPTDQPAKFMTTDFEFLMEQMRSRLDEFHREKQMFQQALLHRDEVLQQRRGIITGIRDAEAASLRFWLERANRNV